MKKLLILTSGGKESTIAHSQYLNGLFGQDEEIAILSPQEAMLVAEEALGIEFELGLHVMADAFLQVLKDTIKPNQKVVIVFGLVKKEDLKWFDDIIGVGATDYNKRGDIRKFIPSADVKDLLKTGVKLATVKNDAPAIFYMKDELTYFLQKYVKVAKDGQEVENEV